MSGVGGQVTRGRATPARRSARARLRARIAYRWARIVMTYLWVALGSALGGMARFWCSGFVAERFGGTFPWGTLMVNVVGSFIIGFFATLTGPDGRFLVAPDVRTFVMIGFCGGYTTFSSFSLQNLTLAQDGEWLQVGGNILLSVALCLASVWLGHVAASSLNELQGA
jgi:CrcB protein